MTETLTRAGVAAAVRALDLDDLAVRRWYAHKGETPASAGLAHAFALSERAALALVDLQLGGGLAGGGVAGGEAPAGRRLERYAIPFVRSQSDGVIREAAEDDGAWRALAVAMAEGRTIPALARDPGALPGAGPGRPGGVEAALVCRPSPGFEAAWGGSVAELAGAVERPLGRDQSNTSIVLGEALLLKGYRRIQPGLNPDLELTAYLAEEARFPGVPRLAGWAEVVSRDGGAATLAMLQAFIADAEDLYEATAEHLVARMSGAKPPDLEAATAVAEDLGTLVAGLHTALSAPPPDVPDLAPRLATHDELRSWRLDAHRQLNRAVAAVAAVDPEAAAELRRDSAAVAARATRFEAVATAPQVMRIHGDLHLGQVLVSADGYRIIDFEGEPLRPVEERRLPDSPLRDIASLLRSLDHVARSARRRAEARHGEALPPAALDVDAWIGRARERFLGAYADGLRRAGSAIMLDLDLLDAFEVAKETYEFVYAATVLPSWLWAPREGMRWLLAHGEDR